MLRRRRALLDHGSPTAIRPSFFGRYGIQNSDSKGLEEFVV
jgi:hypothetical protein